MRSSSEDLRGFGAKRGGGSGFASGMLGRRESGWMELRVDRPSSEWPAGEPVRRWTEVASP